MECAAEASQGKKENAGGPHHHTVVPSEDGELIEAGNEVPAGGDVASYKDAKGQDREGVHRALLPAVTHADLVDVVTEC